MGSIWDRAETDSSWWLDDFQRPSSPKINSPAVPKSGPRPFPEWHRFFPRLLAAVELALMGELSCLNVLPSFLPVPLDPGTQTKRTELVTLSSL